MCIRDRYIRTLFRNWTDLRPTYKDFFTKYKVRTTHIWTLGQKIWVRTLHLWHFHLKIYVERPKNDPLRRSRAENSQNSNFDENSKISKWSYLHVPWVKNPKSRKIQKLIKIPWGRRHGRRPLNPPRREVTFVPMQACWNTWVQSLPLLQSYCQATIRISLRQLKPTKSHIIKVTIKVQLSLIHIWRCRRRG